MTAEIPRRLQQRPTHSRTGFPIPWGVPVIDGEPDFRAIDPDRWMDCAGNGRCQLCGELIKRGGWFVGGPECATNRFFLDPAMHRDCAEYALRVCPFLAARSSHYSNLDRRPAPEGFAVVAAVPTKRPDRFMLGHAPGWAIVRAPDAMLIRAQPWTELHWYRQGQEVAP